MAITLAITGAAGRMGKRLIALAADDVLLKLVADAAKNFSDADIEIVEAHHRFKKDAPSGTALALGKAVGKDVPMHSLRVGDEVGKHTVYFATLGERLELTHVATNRDT